MTDPHAVERIDPARVAVAKHMSPTVYPSNSGCDRIDVRDDPTHEARDIARVATARTMNRGRLPRRRRRVYEFGSRAALQSDPGVDRKW